MFSFLAIITFKSSESKFFRSTIDYFVDAFKWIMPYGMPIFLQNKIRLSLSIFLIEIFQVMISISLI